VIFNFQLPLKVPLLFENYNILFTLQRNL